MASKRWSWDLDQVLSSPEVNGMLCTSTVNCESGEMSIQVLVSGVDKSHIHAWVFLFAENPIKLSCRTTKTI